MFLKFLSTTTFILKHSIRMSSFMLKLNPMTGQSDWLIQNENYDYHQEVARAAFADMLHDSERNEKYEQALKVAIDHMHHKGTRANVLDIGTGTGLLSMMAVRHGADSVVACEAFEPIGKCALEVIALNGFQDKIKVVSKRSTDLVVGEDLEERANILVTEVFDTELIGEGALGTFKHAHENLLTKDCIVVPHRATIYVQVVENTHVRNWNKLKDLYDNDGELLLRIPKVINECRGTAELHDMQLSQLDPLYIKTLLSPQPVFIFDWSGRTPFKMERSAVTTYKAEANGVAHGLFMWWDLNMDIHNKIVLSCAPIWAHPDKNTNKIPWRDHWLQAVYYFPKEITAKKGQDLQLISCCDEFSLWFNLKTDSNISDEDYKCPNCTCYLHTAYSRRRVGQFNDSIRTKQYLKVIENKVNKNTVALILSHGFYIGLATAKKAQKVYCYETSVQSKWFLQQFIEYNNLNNVEIISSPSEVSDKVNFVLADPYFITSILPWDNLLLKTLLVDFNSCFGDDVEIFPQIASIKAVPLKFDDLHKIRMPLNECQGFKMKPFDKLIEASSEICDDNIEAQPLWEYPGKALSKCHELAVINLKAIGPKVVDKVDVFHLDSSQTCNGVAFWVDWIFNTDKPDSNTVSSGPTLPIVVGEKVVWNMHNKQGVCLLGMKNLKGDIKYSFQLNLTNGQSGFKT